MSPHSDSNAGTFSAPTGEDVTVTGSPIVDNDLREILSAPLRWGDLSGKTVLVTGASGMIPSYVVYTLLALNDRGMHIKVVGLVRNLAKARTTFAAISDRSDFVLVEGNVAEEITSAGIIDIIIHGASPARPSLHTTNPVDTIRANIQGTFNLLDACVASGGAHFVLMSSAEVYGQHPDDSSLITEESYGAVDILNPRASYTEGKRAAETIAVSFHAQYEVPITIARFGHIFGPGMALDDGRVQADFTANVVAKNDITLNSDGSALRTYTYIADAVTGMFYALLRGTSTAYNIADVNGFVSIRDLAHAFAVARPQYGLKVRYKEHLDVSNSYPVKGQGLDDARLRALGWAPQAGLAAGIDRTIAWHEERAVP